MEPAVICPGDGGEDAGTASGRSQGSSGVFVAGVGESFAVHERRWRRGREEGRGVAEGNRLQGLPTSAYISGHDALTGEQESYEIGSEQNTHQPNIWLPESVLPGFRAFTTEFYWECWGVAQEVLRLLAIGLDLPDEKYLLRFHDGHNNQLRLLHYPPVPAAALETEASARMPAHTDWGSITMLFQDDCGGLEVETRAGQFVTAPPVKGAIVMNIGDLLMRWSNGISPPLFTARLDGANWDRYIEVESPPCRPAASIGQIHGGGAHDAGPVFDPVLCESECGLDDRVSSFLRR